MVRPTNELKDNNACSIDNLVNYLVYLFLLKCYNKKDIDTIRFKIKSLIDKIEESNKSNIFKPSKLK